jgi:membrane-bound lytic murein transglycosylase A
MRWGARSLAGLAALAWLGSCGHLVPEEPVPTGPALAPVDAIAAGLARGPRVSSLKLAQADAGPALASFVESCPRLLAREDRSGLTRASDWSDACTAASQWEYNKAKQFFEAWFETARVGDGAAKVTGYYEPEIEGSRNRRGDFAIPVYRLPQDLVRAWPEDVPPADRVGEPPLGRYDETGKFVRFHDRAAIEAGALAGEGLEIAWVNDWAEYYFLQVQGSGRVRTPEGETIYLGYAGKNGYPYSSIGALMRERGLIGPGPGQYPGSMQGIIRFLRENPEEGRELMRQNRSWVFFRETPGDGPLGALEVPVRAGSSVAADPAFVPLGAPVFLRLGDPRASGLWIAQDTGGAIKGVNRFDSFWGFGDEAGEIAGAMNSGGDALILLPRGTLGRLGVK